MLVKHLAAALALSTSLIAGAASAATLSALELKQNEWAIFEVSDAADSFTFTPGTTDGSFSYSYAFQNTDCPQDWACRDSALNFGTVYSTSVGNFLNGWYLSDLHYVLEGKTLQAIEGSKYFVFRVNSGTASLGQVRTATNSDSPAPVPLPASALLLAGGLGAMALLRRRKKAA